MKISSIKGGSLLMVVWLLVSHPFIIRAENNTTNIINGVATNAGAVTYYVGQTGTNNYLEIRASGALTNATGVIGFASTASNNYALITASGSRWINTNSLYIGQTGAVNRLTITNAGYVKDDYGYIGYSTNSSGNIVLLTGASARWETGTQLVIGNQGSSNQVTVTNGGQIACHGDSFIGFDVGSNNSVLITGSTSTWTNDGDLYVGYIGFGNQILLTNGARLINGYGFIGSADNPGNAATVTGTNSSWTMSGALTVGDQLSDNNQLLITNGALIASAGGIIGNSAGANGNQVLVTSTNSRWNVSGDFSIGNMGSFNLLTIQNGGLITNATGYIGATAEAFSNTVMVTGSNSRWTNRGDLYVGYHGSGGLLTISNTAQVVNVNGYIGGSDLGYGNDNLVVVVNTNSQWLNSGSLEIGYSGTGNMLIVTNGAKVTSSFGRIGNLGAEETVTLINGTNSQWLNSGDVYVGGDGSFNVLRIENGGLLTNANSYVGFFADNTSATVTGPGSQWKNQGNIYVGYGVPANSLIIESNATVQATNLVVGFFDGAVGNLLSVSSANLIVTNSTNTGIIDVRRGLLSVSNSVVKTTTLLLSTASASLTGVGSLTVSNLTNSGSVNPGLPVGQLILSSNYIQTSTGILNIDLGGTASGTTFDLLTVGGTARLNGVLNVSLTNGFYPASGATFTFLTAALRSNTFATFTYPSNQVGFTVSYTATNATINTINTRPVIGAIGDQVINEGTPWTLAVVATDSDSPAQVLTYALTNSPSGASIDSSGLITWTPTEAQGPMTTNITVVVTDNGTPNLRVFRTFQITVNEVNSPPSLVVPTNQVVNELATLSVSASASDPDLPANPLTFSLVSPPGGMTINPTNGLITWTPNEGQGPGSNVVTVVVTDTNSLAATNNSLSTTNTFVVLVNELNVAPLLTVPTNQVINELTTLSVSASATDADLPANPLTFSLLTGPVGMTINSTNGLISWTPDETQGPSSNFVTIVVTDTNAFAVNSQSLSATNSFSVVVNEANVAPTLTVPTNQVLDELTTLSVAASAMDADVPANPLTFSLISPPSGMVINPTNGLITWTPGEDQGPSSNVITVVVTDTNAFATSAKSLSTTNTFVVVVNEVNVAPVLTVPTDQVIDELTTLSVSAHATDADLPANPLIYLLVAAPAGMTINPTNGSISWTPGEEQGPSSNVVTVVVTDTNAVAVNNTSLSATNSFTVVVNEVNVAPLLTVPTNQTINELTTLNVSASATDLDDPPNQFAFALVSPPTGMTINPTTGAITWTPDEGQGPSTNVVTVVVTDTNSLAVNNKSLSATNIFTVIVNEFNVAPVLSVPADQAIDELTPLNVSASATDADFPPNPLTYSLLSPPVGMAISPTTGAITWTPGEDQGPSSNIITVVVTDTNAFAVNSKSLSATNTFVVVVNEVNVVPVLTVPTNQVVDESVTLSVSTSATDADIPTNALTFSLVSPPPGMTINPLTGQIAWTPSEAQGPSSNLITVVVTDTNSTAINAKSLSSTNTFVVFVNEVNAAPVLTVPTNQTINELTALNVNASATDTDDPPNPLIFSLVSPPTGMTIDSATGAITWTPDEGQGPSTNVVTVVVTDTNSLALSNKSLSATNAFTVVVNELNVAPVLSVPTNQIIDELTPLNVSVSATDADIPANPLTYSLLSPPAGMTINLTTGVITWTPDESQGPSTNIISVVVTDTNAFAVNSKSLSATNTFKVTVREVNVAPILTVPSDRTIHAGTLYSARATATDADLPTNTLTFSLVSGPAGLTVNDTGTVTWPTGDANAGTTNQVTLRVSDNGIPSLSATNTFNVVVAARPLLLRPLLSNTNALLTWTAIPGTVYQLQFNIDSSLTNWLSSPGDVTAISNRVSKPEPLVISNRIYRVQVAP